VLRVDGPQLGKLENFSNPWQSMSDSAILRQVRCTGANPYINLTSIYPCFASAPSRTP
jgi:hypothetical protein